MRIYAVMYDLSRTRMLLGSKLKRTREVGERWYVPIGHSGHKDKLRKWFPNTKENILTEVITMFVEGLYSV